MKQFVNIYCLLLFFVSGTLFSQEIELTGKVTDSLGVPMEMANVVAIYNQTNKVASFSITNGKGEYRLRLETQQTYNISISFLGHTTITTKVSVKENSNDIIKNFTLLENSALLDEVTITYEMPITIKGDTIAYKADAFTNGTERKLGDVLKKLPGIEINTDGLVEIEGQQVRKIMVEGKDFFDGDSKLAVENIPSDAIDKVEVLRNFTEVEQLRNVTNNMDSFALNIKLKEGKKKFWFGELSAGAGLDERYTSHPKLFYYSPEKSINIIANTNNIGQLPFTRRDFFRFTGGFRNLSSGSGTSLNITTDNLGFSNLKDNKAKELSTQFGATNFSYAPTKSWDISGFFIFSDTKTDLSELTTKNYLDGCIENTESETQQNNTLGLGKISSLYKPNKNFQLDYDAFLKLSEQNEDNNLTSQFASQENTIQTHLNDKPFSIDQNLNAYYTLNPEHIFSLEAQYLWSREYPFYNATFLDVGSNPSPNELPFSSLFPYDVEQNDYSLNQDKYILTNKWEGKLDYYLLFSKTSNLRFTFGSMINNQNFDSSLFQVLDNGSQNNFSDAEFKNDAFYRFKDIYGAFHYRTVLGKLILDLGASLHHYKTDIEQLGTNYIVKEQKILPDFSVVFQFKKSESLRFNYSLTAQYPDINTLAQGYVMKNYNSLFSGNPTIEEGLYENYRLNYSSFSLFNYTNVLAILSYSKRNDPIKNRIDFNQINQIVTPFNSELADEVLSGSMNWEKTFFGKYKLGLKARLSFSTLYNATSESITKSEEMRQDYTASLSTNFKKWPNFEVGYNKIINDYQLATTQNKFFTDRPFANLQYSFLNGFQFDLDYSYFNYANEEQSLNTYSFLDSKLSYRKEGSRWEYQVSATNLLNTGSINQDSFTDSFSSTSEYYVQPRYLIFNLTYYL